MADICDLGGLSQGYKLYFKSSVFQNDDDDTTETILAQLEEVFTEIQAFEADVSAKWNG